MRATFFFLSYIGNVNWTLVCDRIENEKKVEAAQLSSIDPVIKKETQFISYVVLVLSALLEAVYLIIGHWNYTVLLGNVLGGGAGILNFFLMGMGLQNALNKNSADAKTTVSFSHTYRNIMMLAVLAVAYFAPCFDIIPTIIALFFATIGVYIKVFIMKKTDTADATNEVGGSEE